MLEMQLSENVLASFFNVYRRHGYGFLEGVYANSMAVELQLRGIPVRREVSVAVFYERRRVGTYRIDLVVDGRIMIEVKSSKMITEADERRLLNYLKATKIEVGFLLHFGPDPRFRRLILTNDRK